jgi:HlyD family secretion protein
MKYVRSFAITLIFACNTTAIADTLAEPAVAAPGLVEPYGEERTISSEIIGVVKDMKVEENTPVTAGQVIAIIENSEITARLASAKAEVALAQAELDKLTHGARPEERRQAEAKLAEADAQFTWAKKEVERRRPLARSDVISASTMDDINNQLAIAVARRQAAVEALDMIKIGTRQEDIAAGQAKLDIAKAAVANNQALLDKTIVRSPIDGIVLRRWRATGEAVGNIPPSPIVTIGDLSRLRVRAEVDETDIAHVELRHRVRITADAFPGRGFGGTISSISKQVGSKQIDTGRPTERVDSKVLQVLIDLDSGIDLPVGLRVDAFIER